MQQEITGDVRTDSQKPQAYFVTGGKNQLGKME
jgi:hypothetical protein